LSHKGVFSQFAHLEALYNILSEVDKGMEVYEYAYKILSNQSFSIIKLKDSKKANFIYVYEIIERLHWAAISSILRCKRWMDGLINSIETNNFIIFSSSFRGLLESAGDSIFTFEHIPIREIEYIKTNKNYNNKDKKSNLPIDLMYRYDLMVNSLKGQNSDLGNTVSKLRKIEDKLINFNFAKQSHDDTPYSLEAIKNRDVYIARKANEYVNILGIKFMNNGLGEFEESYKLYASLCEYVHSSSDSTLYFYNNINNVYKFNSKADQENINNILKKNEALLYLAIESQIVLPIMILKIINSLGLKQLFTKNLFDVSFTDNATWLKINEVYNIKIQVLEKKYRYSEYRNVPCLNEYSQKFRKKINYHTAIKHYEELDLSKMLI